LANFSQALIIQKSDSGELFLTKPMAITRSPVNQSGTSGNCQRNHNLASALIALLTFLLAACSSTKINDTAYAYFIAEDKLRPPPEKILVAPKNFGLPSKTYLEEYESYIDEVLIDRLESHGFKVVAGKDEFEAAWRRAERKYGKPFSVSESRLNENAFRRVMYHVFTEVGTNTNADAILFTDLLEQSVVFTGGTSRRARWHGVSRAPMTRGGNQLPVGFDWSQPVPGVSLRVTIYSVEGNLLFKSFGGLDVSRQVDTQKEQFTRRKDIFTSARNVQQGVAIALHPFIPVNP